MIHIVCIIMRSYEVKMLIKREKMKKSHLVIFQALRQAEHFERLFQSVKRFQQCWSNAKHENYFE